MWAAQQSKWLIKSVTLPPRPMTFVTRTYESLRKQPNGTIDVAVMATMNYCAVGAIVLFSGADDGHEVLVPISLKEIQRSYWDDLAIAPNRYCESGLWWMDSVCYEEWNPSEDNFKQMMDESFDVFCECWVHDIRCDVRNQVFEAFHKHESNCTHRWEQACQLIDHKFAECPYTSWTHAMLKQNASVNAPKRGPVTE